MKKKLLMLAGVASAMAFAATVQATPITGTINMGGNVTLNSTSLSSATTASFSTPSGTVSGGSGSFGGVGLGTLVDFYGFNIVVGAQSVTPLWAFTYSSVNYSFDLTAINSISVNGADTSMLIGGSGIVNIGSDSQYANWTFTITDSSAGKSGVFNFGFSDSNTSVPDGGTTVAMLGLALSGIGLLSRKLRRA